MSALWVGQQCRHTLHPIGRGVFTKLLRLLHSLIESGQNLY